MDDDRLSEGEVEQEQEGTPFEYPDDKTPEERWEFDQAVRRGTLADPRFKPGLQTIIPAWRQDYPALCEQWRREHQAWTR